MVTEKMIEAFVKASSVASGDTMDCVRAGLEAALSTDAEPVGARYDFDGNGFQYIDSGSGSDWKTRKTQAEMLYDRPQQPDFFELAEIREQKLATIAAPDNGTMAEVLAAVLECAEAWVPDARIIGNVRAGDIARVVRSVLSTQAQDVAGWQSMDSAPKDGKHCLLAVKSDCFVYAVQGAFMMGGEWSNAADIKSEPLCWMPLTRIPQVFLPWTDEFAAAARAAKQDVP